MANMLNLGILSQSSCIPLVESLILVFFCLFVMLILPRQKTGVGTVFTLVLLVGYVFGNKTLDPVSNFWLKASLPISVLIVGYMIVIAKRFLIKRNEKEKTSTDSSGTDKTLGLFYHQQGMLDLAFDKFRSVAHEEDAKDLLYNLALDYEKRGQIKKAIVAYKMIIRKDSFMEDLDDNLAGPSDTETGTLVEEERGNRPGLAAKADIKPTIGGYEISREMGRDSLGVIFKGRDIKTGSAAAIKTVKFSEFDEGHLADIKDRFYAEIESSRLLTHSNIVTFYEGGEEHGLFFIATEYLEGEGLEKYTSKGHLLPIKETLSIIGCAADALDYAHKKDVVHRHIRPASIIRSQNSRDVKVAGFGTAWIASATKTKLDSLKEAHFYMSPEQIAGKKVDGRSDIFSLGVVLFEMLTGERPFTGENMASIMLKISKEKHPSPSSYNPKIPRVIEKIIDRALEKDLDKRYQTAAQLASHLNKVVARIEELVAQKRSRTAS